MSKENRHPPRGETFPAVGFFLVGPFCPCGSAVPQSGPRVGFYWSTFLRSTPPFFVKLPRPLSISLKFPRKLLQTQLLGFLLAGPKPPEMSDQSVHRNVFDSAQENEKSNCPEQVLWGDRCLAIKRMGSPPRFTRPQPPPGHLGRSKSPLEKEIILAPSIG